LREKDGRFGGTMWNTTVKILIIKTHYFLKTNILVCISCRSIGCNVKIVFKSWVSKVEVTFLWLISAPLLPKLNISSILVILITQFLLRISYSWVITQLKMSPLSL
jgi:hypothetical protein